MHVPAGWFVRSHEVAVGVVAPVVLGPAVGHVGGGAAFTVTEPCMVEAWAAQKYQNVPTVVNV